ncbi:MAG TPA: NAD-binding protein, partial [Chloroflexia bacterium]|nr:NAD-binding protein [Chloroflexia bacterium]
DAEGHQVSVIDAVPVSLSRLPEDFGGQSIVGTGIDVDVLKSAGIENADAFAAVTNFDNTNIMACEVAKEIFGVKKVLARIYDPGRESLYHKLGLETICPTTLISTTARDILEAPEGAEILPFPPHNIASHNHDRAPIPAAAPSALSGAVAHASTAAADAAYQNIQAPQPQPPAPVAQAPAPPEEPEKAQQNGRGLRNLFKH